MLKDVLSSLMGWMLDSQWQQRQHWFLQSPYKGDGAQEDLVVEKLSNELETTT